MANVEHFAAACNTIKASWWTLLMSRLFGHKTVGIDTWAGEHTIVTAYRWRGVLYVHSFKNVPAKSISPLSSSTKEKS